jgi:tetratricopeptide (TPR) repeat protein
LFNFQHIEYLFALAALIPIWILYAFVIQWKKSRIKKIGDPALVNQLISDYSPQKFSLKFILFSIAFALAVVALANPRKPQGNTNVKRNGIDVIIALDVSKSMLAEDIRPNRLDRAKQFITKLIDKLSDDRIGIVVFAGRAYLQMPLTSDHTAAKMYLSSATTDVVPTQGTVIGDALKMSYAAFNTKEKKYKSIILISDGEDHDETADKITAALAEEGVMVNTVGIGSTEGAPIRDAATGDIKKDAEGRPVITRLNEAALKNIASKGNGIYQLFTNADEVTSAMDAQLKSMEQRSITETSMINYQNFSPWFLAVTLLLLLTDFFMTEKKSETQAKKLKTEKLDAAKVKAAFAVLVLIYCGMLVPANGFTQNTNSLIKKGNGEYKKSQYEAAVGSYKKAVEKNKTNETAQYNLGNALYKDGKTDDALQAYDDAIAGSKSPADKGGTWYNKGVILQNNKKLPECIEAYKNALKLNPADEDARLNLQKALQQQKKEQQPKEKKDQKKKEDKKRQQNPQEQQPKPQPSKMTKKEAEEKLKALLQQEKNLQDRLRKVGAASPDKPEKDW